MKITSLNWWLGRTEQQVARRDSYKVRRDNMRQARATVRAAKRPRRRMWFIVWW